MSNLLKSKFFYGVMIVAIMFVGGLTLTASAQTTTVIAPTFTYSGVMKVGMSGPGISTLQAALNTVNGVNATIVVDGKFGPATLLAVKQFQASHNLVADGVVGPMTGTALAQATVSVVTIPTGSLPAGCTSTSGFSTTTGVKCSSTSSSLPAGCTSTSGFSSTTGAKCSGGSTASDGSLDGDETSISDVNVNDADDDTLDEGSNKAPVAEIEFDVDDADAELVRADIVFQAENSSEEAKPWRVFDKVYLMDGSKVLASMASDDEDVWDDVDLTGSNNAGFTGTEDAYRIRFNNVGEVYDEDTSASLWVAVDVSSSVDGADAGADWTVGVEDDGLRFTDGAGLDTFEDTADTAGFSIEQAGANSEFNVSKADNSPDAQTIEVKENASTTATIAIFTIDADEDGGDVKLDDFPVTITVVQTGAGEDVGDSVDDVMVVIDGTEYSADQSPSTTDANQTFTFNDIEDDDVVIDAGDDLDVTVKVKFHSQGTNGATFLNGTTITASAALDENDVEDADSGDNLDADNVDGTATGETMTLAGNGIMVEVNSATTSIQEIDSVTNDVATFTWSIDVTAFGDDAYINKDFADIVLDAGKAALDVDTIYIIDYSNASPTALTASGTISDDSDADEVTGAAGYTSTPYTNDTFFKIEEGETETFTITVTGTNAGENKQVRASLVNIEFTNDEVDNAAATGASSIQSYTANLMEESQTPFKNIQ